MAMKNWINELPLDLWAWIITHKMTSFRFRLWIWGNDFYRNWSSFSSMHLLWLQCNEEHLNASLNLIDEKRGLTHMVVAYQQKVARHYNSKARNQKLEIRDLVLKWEMHQVRGVPIRKDFHRKKSLKMTLSIPLLWTEHRSHKHGITSNFLILGICFLPFCLFLRRSTLVWNLITPLPSGFDWIKGSFELIILCFVWCCALNDKNALSLEAVLTSGVNQ